MSKRKSPTSSEITNPTLVDSTNYREKAKRLKHEHDAWEKKQSFEVIRPDRKTIVYRKLPNSVAMLSETNKGKRFINGIEIHKGRI